MLVYQRVSCFTSQLEVISFTTQQQTELRGGKVMYNSFHVSNNYTFGHLMKYIYIYRYISYRQEVLGERANKRNMFDAIRLRITCSI